MRSSRPGLRTRSEAERTSAAPSLAVLLCLLALLLSPAAPADAQHLRTHLSADSVKVGERFRLSLAVDHNFATQVRLPVPSPDSSDAPLRFGDLVVLALRDSSRRYLGRAGMQRDSVVYEVTTFALDTARVGPVPVAFVQQSGDTVRTATAERLLPVQSVLPPDVRAGRDTAQLRPLTPPVPFPRPLWPWLLGAMGVLALAAVLGFLWWQHRRHRGENEARTPERPPVPPAEAARRRLRRLEQTTDLTDPGAAKPFYTDLARTLRRYLRHRLGLRAFRSTTPELVAHLRRRADGGSLPASVPDRTRRALNGADLAKFADQRPAAEARRDALADAHAVIDAVEDALRPTPPEPSDAQTPGTGPPHAEAPDAQKPDVEAPKAEPDEARPDARDATPPAPSS